MIYRAIVVHGVVQGVSFRYSTKKKADELEISGSVQNRYDGSVLVHASGSEEKMSRFIEWCHIGPKAAVVNNVEIKSLSKKSFSSFEILPS